MTRDQATVGTRVRSLVDFNSVPNGTRGIIDEDYGTGVMVRWDDPIALRDGFDKDKELQFLEVI